VATAIANQAMVLDRRGDHRAAERRSREAALLARSMGDVDREANAVSNLGSAQGHQGRHDEALQSYGAAVAIYRAAGGKPRGLSFALSNLGHNLMILGRAGEARVAFEDAASIARAVPSPRAIALAQELAALPQQAYRRTRELTRRDLAALFEVSAEAEAAALAAGWVTDETRAQMAAALARSSR
jgi:tetratricopeptide (TPR) repeat protein